MRQAGRRAELPLRPDRLGLGQLPRTERRMLSATFALCKKRESETSSYWFREACQRAKPCHLGEPGLGGTDEHSRRSGCQRPRCVNHTVAAGRRTAIFSAASVFVHYGHRTAGL